MTIDQAIEFLGPLRKDLIIKGMPTFSEALQLGIEALKRLRVLRQDRLFDRAVSLPGETED